MKNKPLPCSDCCAQKDIENLSYSIVKRDLHTIREELLEGNSVSAAYHLGSLITYLNINESLNEEDEF